jgi:cellulose biosynthesis protein BcsQ
MERTLKYLTWLDVQRLIRRNTNDGRIFPKGITRISCFSDAIEVGILSPQHIETVQATFRSWFGAWYLDEIPAIQLDIGEAHLAVEFLEESNNQRLHRTVYPFWKDVSYIQQKSTDSDSNPQQERITLPTALPSKPEICAFYSFKGGVGRTLHLAAYLFSLLDAAREVGKTVSILVIDADLEAPGLTYWDRLDNQNSSISFPDFLEAYHYSPVSRDETLGKLAKEIQKSQRRDGKSVYYFLPACLEDAQLLDMPILPEHLSRSPEGAWACVDAIHKLGERLEVDYILIDLRAGLSEISSPILFDPRVHRFFITPASEQSVSGISLVLDQLSHITPSDADIESGIYYDPSVIISLLTPELRQLSMFEETLERFINSYNKATPESGELFSRRILQIQETDFAQELMHINGWGEARTKIPGTSISRIAKEWASSRFHSGDEPSQNIELGDVVRLKDICQKYEFAESGKGEDLLVTESLRNLATSFRDILPQAVSIGSKGAGKTFTYLQITRSGSWENFVGRVLENFSGELEDSTPKSYVFPMLQSKNLEDDANAVVSQARDLVCQVLGAEVKFVYSECSDRILANLSGQMLTELEWYQFWINEFAKAIYSEPLNNGTHSLSSIDLSLKNRNLKFVFLFDGLEDIFQDVSSSPQHQNALRALLDIPRRLQEIRHASLGIVILLRRDFLRYTFKHNIAQFENLYSKYDLFWNVDSFLRLALWICAKAEVINAQISEVDTLSSEQLVERLESLWGKKLGSETSNEAYTQNWIFAALTDFKGRLQARDIVRFLYHAALITINQSKDVQFGRWSANRLIPPQAIRRALEPCSAKKVEEMGEEYPEFKNWADFVRELPKEQRNIPFTMEELQLEASTIRTLEEIGVIYEDVEKKDETAKFYMPEIFRTGLQFTLKAGSRPRVLVLKRKALGGRGNV